MGRKGSNNNKGNNATTGVQPRSMTLREKSSGKKHINVNAKTMCKVDHLKSIAAWAGASVPSLGAFLGERLAATTEALDLRADPSLFVCERCESILQPGSNCTVRIESNKSKARRNRRKKSNPVTQNNVVYTCHFCSHRNSMRGTPKGYVNKLCPPKAKAPKPQLKLDTVKSGADKCPSSTKSESEVNKVGDTISLPAAYGETTKTSSPATPGTTSGLSLLDSKRKRRNRSNVKKVAEHETSLTLSAAGEEKDRQCSSKRRRKTWTTLKEIAQSGGGGNANSKKLSDLTIPFFI